MAKRLRIRDSASRTTTVDLDAETFELFRRVTAARMLGCEVAVTRIAKLFRMLDEADQTQILHELESSPGLRLRLPPGAPLVVGES